jgi:hypothetical protein
MAGKNVRKVARKLIQSFRSPEPYAWEKYEETNPTVYERATRRVARLLKAKGGSNG